MKLREIFLLTTSGLVFTLVLHAQATQKNPRLIEAKDLNSEAHHYLMQGKYERAEPLLRRALAIDEEVLGPESYSVAVDLKVLAELYRDQGRDAEAEPLLRRALVIKEKSQRYASNVRSSNLVQAAKAGDLERVRSLLAEGVDVNMRDRNGFTALMAASGPEGQQYTQIVKALLASGADVNASNSGNTALMYASQEYWANEDIVAMLLEKGANPNIQNDYGGTALLGAVVNMNLAVARALLKKGADPNLKSTDGATALITAVQRWPLARLSVIKFLVDCGTDVKARDNRGNTALSLAETRHSTAVLDLLKAAGGNAPDQKTESSSTTKEARPPDAVAAKQPPLPLDAVRRGELQPFSAEVIETQGRKERLRGQVFSSGEAFRVEGKTDDGEIVDVERHDRKVRWTWTIEPADRIVVEMPLESTRDFSEAMRDKEAQVTRQPQGDEQVGRYHCTKYHVRVISRGQTFTGYEWTATELGGLPARLEDKDGLAIEYRNVHLGPQDSGLFELPSGYKKVLFPADRDE